MSKEEEVVGRIEFPDYVVVDIETTGLTPWFGDRVTCIGAKVSNGRAYCKSLKDEARLLLDFSNWFNAEVKNEESLFITKNGKIFDIPFICARAIAHDMLKLKAIKRILNMEQFDLHEITKDRVKLNDMAALYSIEGKLGDGLGAIELWKKGMYEQLENYCWRDVELTEEVFKVYLLIKGTFPVLAM